MSVGRRSWYLHIIFTTWLAMVAEHLAVGQSSPVLNTVLPSGGQVGQSVEVTVAGSNLEGLRTLHCSIPSVGCERLDANRWRLTVPGNAPLGLCDVWAISDSGISSPRTFVIGNRPEHLESEPNDKASEVMAVPLDIVLNGQIDKAGDVDRFRFEAKRGQRVIIECSAERIDSRLRAVLEVFDATGKRLAVNRGYFGIDPLIDFPVPYDGSYIVKIQSLTSVGSAEHYYRLAIDTGPRVAFTMPNVVRRGQETRVTLYGWNLTQASGAQAYRANASGAQASAANANGITEAASASESPTEFAGTAELARSASLRAPNDRNEQLEYERLEVEIPASLAEATWPLPVRCQSQQATFEGFAYQPSGIHMPVMIGVTDVPVVLENGLNHSPSTAQEIVAPCEVSGQLVASDKSDWFAISALRGETFFIEALGQRIQSPVDLQVSVFDATGEFELAQFGDEVRNIGGAFPTNHLDPAGRWVSPADGRYLLAIRNLIGGLQADPRRTYRLSVRREEPDFHVVAMSRPEDSAGLNVRRGGRAAIDLLAFRRRGCDGAIRVSAKDLPVGVECPDVWLGPGVDRATLIVSADKNASELVGQLKLESNLEPPSGAARLVEPHNNARQVRSGTLVRTGVPTGWGRMTSQLPFVVSGDAPLRITADGHEPLQHHLYGKLTPKHSPGGVLDVVVNIEWSKTGDQAPVKLIGVGLPDMIRNQATVIPAKQSKGYLSFFLPPTMPVGHYSLAIRGETTVTMPDMKTVTVSIVSNPVSFEVHPAAMLVEVDPFAVTRAKRGETITVGYTSKRLNGFIGKMHTELAAPGQITDVTGLLARGETFTGLTEKGSLQVVINDDAALGLQQFLRLFTVGVVEDVPTHFGCSLIPLEIVE